MWFKDILNKNLIPYIKETMLLTNVFQDENTNIHKYEILTNWLKDQSIESQSTPRRSAKIIKHKDIIPDINIKLNKT